MQTAGYVQILGKLHLFFELCETLDLRNQAELGRFGIYEGRLKHLIANIEAIQMGAPEGSLFAKIAPELPIFMAALSEAFRGGERIWWTKVGSRFRGGRRSGWVWGY